MKKYQNEILLNKNKDLEDELSELQREHPINDKQKCLLDNNLAQTNNKNDIELVVDDNHGRNEEQVKNVWYYKIP